MTDHADALLAFVHNSDSGRWTIETHRFAELHERLGSDVLNAFCRCFVHTDRLTSLTGFALMSEDRYGRGSPAFERDLQTMVWFAVGTLRELATAIGSLRSALVKRRRFDSSHQAWITLTAVQRRWQDDPQFRVMRNVVAFHVDPKLTDAGLKALNDTRRVILVQGHGRPQRHTFLRLGLEALFMGVDMNIGEMGEFLAHVGRDQGIGDAVQEAFLLALRDVGITLAMT